MIEADGETVIGRPIDEVFDFLADCRNEPAWLPGAVRVELVSDEPIGRGTRFVGQYARAGRVELELVEYEKPTRVTFRARARILDFDDAVVLSDESGRTRLRARIAAEPRGAMKLAAPLMARTLRRQFAGNWDHLRAALERR